MTAATFEASEERGHVSIVLSGEVDLDNAPEIEAKIHQALDSELSAVTLDLSALNYVDSTGMRVLFLLASKLEGREVPLVVVCEPGSMARRVIELSGLTSLVSLRP